jgi:hypothetical protein
MTNLPPKTDAMASFALRLRAEHTWLAMTFPTSAVETLASADGVARHYLTGGDAQEVEILHSDGGPWRLVRSFKLEISVTDHGERERGKRSTHLRHRYITVDGVKVHYTYSLRTCLVTTADGRIEFVATCWDGAPDELRHKLKTEA